jgi:hypothetical protein
MTSNGRVARLTALALATGTLVAAGASSAAAATTTTDKIQALGNGQVLHVRIALPVALPQVGQIIDQYISMTDGTVTTVNNLGAHSVAQIGKGAVPVISGLLAGTATSDLAGKQTDAVALADQDVAALGLSLKALSAKSNVAKPTLDGVLAHSESTVAAVQLNALALPALNTATKPVVDALTNVVDTAQQTVNSATGTVTGVLNTAIDQLNAATNNAATPVSAPVQAAVAQVTSQLDQLLTLIQTQIGGLDSNAKLIDLGIMKSEQTISRTGAQVTSKVTNSLAGLSLLGGLVSVDALSSEASATAGGKAGTAAVTHVPGVLTVKVADALTLKIGKTIELGGTLGDALPADLKKTVNDTLATVLGLLRDQLGLDFQPGAFVENVAKDGSSAATTVNSAKLVLNPPALAALLPKGEKLITVEMVGAQAAVGAQVISISPNKPVITPPNTVTALPRTGANLPLTGAAATALIALALVARRRRLGSISE